MASDSPLEHLASALPEVYDQILERLTPTARSFLAASSPVLRAARRRCALPDRERRSVFTTAELLRSLGTVRWAQARGWSPETTLRPMRASTRPGGPVAHVIGAIGAPVEVVRAFRPEETKAFGFDKTCVCAAAENGRARVLAHLFSLYYSRHDEFWELVVAALDRAARADRVEVVDWLWHAVVSEKKKTRASLRRVAGAAAEGGALGVLRWCHGTVDGEVVDLEPPRVPRERLRDVLRLTASEQSNDCAIAAFGGHLDALKLMTGGFGFWFNEWTCTRAAEGGQLDVLKWLRENGCPWDCNVLRRAEARGHARVAAWARDNGCPAEASDDDDDDTEYQLQFGYLQKFYLIDYRY